MGEYEVRPLNNTPEEFEVKNSFNCPPPKEKFPGPISAWKKEDEYSASIKSALFITLQRFVDMIAKQRHVYLLEIAKSGPGIWYVFTDFRMNTEIPHSTKMSRYFNKS